MSRLGIIGAGPAGMMAALEARKKGREVVLFDANDRVGRKLLVTGSGRCNLTNAAAAPEKYHSSSLAVLQSVFSQFSYQDLMRSLHEMGILTQTTADGWVYPLSYSAANVADIFAAHLEDAQVQVKLGHKVTEIIPGKAGYLLKFAAGQAPEFVEQCVLASGGKAYPTLGSDGSLFSVLQRLGHAIVPVHPALAPLRISQKTFQAIEGVRVDALVRLLADNQPIGETSGNIIFTRGGINGPGVMDLSYLVNQYPRAKLEVEIDFLADHQSALKKLMQTYAHSTMPVRALLGAVIAPKIAESVLQDLGFSQNKVLCDLSPKDFDRIYRKLTKARATVDGVRNFDFCQLSTGGISLKEVQPDSLESRLLPGLYFAGEVLDVNGPCGGYNLQWAFSSGVVAGRSAAKA